MATLVREGLLQATQSAVHLEMRDSYGVADEAEEFAAWKQGRWEEDRDAAKRKGWLDLVQATVRRGVTMRRARIVSLPPTDYIRFEHQGTSLNIEAGEDVRWLSRKLAADIALPGVDFWCFDERVVVFNHFTGDGQWAEPPMERRTEAAVAKLCSDAFDAVWERAISHADFVL